MCEMMVRWTCLHFGPSGNHGNSCWVGSFPSFSTGLNRQGRPDFSALVSEIGSLALILCFLVARGSVCPAFHCENHLEVFVLKKRKVPTPLSQTPREGPGCWGMSQNPIVYSPPAGRCGKEGPGVCIFCFPT